MTSYVVELGDVERDRDRVLALWQRCAFGGSPELLESRYRWFYQESPAGPARMYLLLTKAGGELVGTVGAGTRHFHVGDAQRLSGALLVDFVIAPEHRTMFPALQLQREARLAELAQMDFVYGLPDVKAVPVFKRLGGTRVFDAGVHVRVIRCAYLLHRWIPQAPAALVSLASGLVDAALMGWSTLRSAGQGMVTDWKDGVPDESDELAPWSGDLATCALGVRDRAFLEWRCALGDGAYRTLIVSDRLSGVPKAWFICRQDDAELFVLDFLLPAESEVAVAALYALARAAWAVGARAVRTNFSGPPGVQRLLVGAGYSKRGSRPCFIVGGGDPGDSALPRDWWLTRVDEDV